MDKKALKKKIGAWRERYEVKIVLFGGFCLVSIISFEFGLLQGQKWQQIPLVIEKPANIAENTKNALKTQDLSSKNDFVVNLEPTAETKSPVDKKNCAFVGSKNSNKFHLPTCRWAKQIKPENLVCFESAEEAAQKKYQADKNCIK